MGSPESKYPFGGVAFFINHSHPFLFLSLLSAAVGCGLYGFEGYSSPVTALWGVSLVAGALHFRRWPAIQPVPLIPAKSDLWILALLLAVFAPLYLFLLYDIPVEMNTDEVVILIMAMRTTANSELDLFGLSGYFQNPNLIFYVVGSLADALGGVDWPRIRLVNGLVGLMIVGVSYLFLRMVLASQFLAALGAILIGSYHALLAISRMALRDNSALLFETAALLFLFHGLRARSLLASYIGGAIAGFAYFGYAPGRFAIVIWCLFLALVFVFRSASISRTRLIKLAAATSLGFAFMIGPLAVSSLQSKGAVPEYHRQQFLFLSEGRAMQQSWNRASSELEGVKINVINGLTAFNNGLSNNSGIYSNPGHGFVDPLTGILIWVGLLAVLWRRVRTLEDLLSVTGFLALLFVLSFVVNKAPNYTRMLLFLPFTTYLVIHGLQAAVNGLASLPRRWPAGRRMRLRAGGMAAAVGLIAVLNLGIYGSYVAKGFAAGEGVGNTIRYVEARHGITPYAYYFVMSSEHVYKVQGQEWDWWLRRFGPFAGADQTMTLVPPEQAQSHYYRMPSSLFMNEKLWTELGDELAAEYGAPTVHKLSSRHVAVELGRSANSDSDNAVRQEPCAEYHDRILGQVCRLWHRVN